MNPQPGTSSCPSDNALQKLTTVRMTTKYREPQWYYLVRFKKDSLLHVSHSNGLHYRRRRCDSKVVTFAKYGTVWYECKLLCRHRNKKFLQREQRAATLRSQAVLSRRAVKNSSTFALVQFNVTNDVQLVASEDVVTSLDGESMVKGRDGVSRPILVIQMGGKFFLLWDFPKCS